MTSAELFFQNLFGARGVTDTELSTSSARAHLQETYAKLGAKLGTFSGDKLVHAVDLSQRIARHLQTYPEIASELVVWNSTAAALETEAKAYLGFPMGWLLIGGAAAVVVAVALMNR
jgi:hypothetical protein